MSIVTVAVSVKPIDRADIAIASPLQIKTCEVFQHSQWAYHRI
jgi:hypothetical protein